MNTYRGYFPNSVNGKEGLDLGDLKITPHNLKKYRSPFIEYLDLNRSFDKSSIKSLSNYFDEIPTLSTVVGILIIVSSGIYIFIREKAQDQSIATEKPLR